MAQETTMTMSTYNNDIIPVPEERGYYNPEDGNVYLETKYILEHLGFNRVTANKKFLPTSGQKFYEYEGIRLEGQ